MKNADINNIYHLDHNLSKMNICGKYGYELLSHPFTKKQIGFHNPSKIKNIAGVDIIFGEPLQQNHIIEIDGSAPEPKTIAPDILDTLSEGVVLP